MQSFCWRGYTEALVRGYESVERRSGWGVRVWLWGPSLSPSTKDSEDHHGVDAHVTRLA